MPPPRPRSAPAKPRGGWTALADEAGNVYYYHKASGATSWEMPEQLKQPSKAKVNSSKPAAAAPPASKWQEFTTASGQRYFFNSETK